MARPQPRRSDRHLPLFGCRVPFDALHPRGENVVGEMLVDGGFRRRLAVAARQTAFPAQFVKGIGHVLREGAGAEGAVHDALSA